MTAFAAIALALIVTRLIVELWLTRANERHVRSHATVIPDAFRGIVDEGTYKKSVDYTLAKARLDKVELLYETAILLVVLFSGVLPFIFERWVNQFGPSAWSMAGFLFSASAALSIPAVPFAWHRQFRLEQRFGFNTTTVRLWLVDRVKGFVLAVVLGYPILILILKVVGWMGPNWWLWAWALVVAVQLLLMLIAPAVIMPLFNKFTPLPDGSLRDRLFALAQRTGFPTRSIDIMDGSKRSRHSNAFFTGFGRFRKIVLFDTLVEQLSEPELEAVLAHEIGHYKKRHIMKMVGMSVLSLLAGFWLIAWLAQQPWFYAAFGFEPQSGFSPVAITPALLLFSLLSSAATFWLAPLMNAWSRRYEYQADRYARDAMNEPESLIGALRKLTEKNLSNLTPHPLYSGFHYSHPTLVERERALRR
jgi:STE24 endopeptidase